MKASILPILLLCPICSFGYTFDPLFMTDGVYETISLYDMYGEPTGETFSLQMRYVYDPTYKVFSVFPTRLTGNDEYYSMLSNDYKDKTLKDMFDWMGGWYPHIQICDENMDNCVFAGSSDNEWQILTELENQYIEYLTTHIDENSDNLAEILDGFIFDDDIAYVRNVFISHLTLSPANAQTMSAIVSARHIMRQQNTAVTGLAFDRFSKAIGRSGGDEPGRFGVWGQTTYNHAKMTGNNAFSGDTLGLVLGADTRIGNNITFGLGYNYNTTTISNYQPDLDITMHTVFAYGQYRPSALFFNGMLGYNTGDYTGDNTDARGDLSGFMSSIIAGYDTPTGISPQIGFRYSNITIAPNNANVAKYDSDIFTVVSGLGYEYQPTESQISIRGHAFMTYDITRADSDISMSIPALAYTYTVTDSIPRLGLEVGIKLEIPISDVTLSAGYDISIRSHYVSHTGAIRARYEF